MSLTQLQTDPGSETEPSRTMIRSVGKCRILAELGHGGMANVYLAVQRGHGGFNKLVVLKALRPELAVEPTLSMFLDEARVAAQLNHPNVVQTYEVGSHNDRNVIVMEYLEGQSFSQILRQSAAQGKELPLAAKLRILSNALDGLHYAHELTSYDGTRLDLVHRDVSPQNIFVTYNGQVKVLDFGIAKAASSTTQTAAGVVKGKLSYMAPEQLSGDALDRRADVFSAGCILWSFATGQRLWQDLSDVQVMRKLWDGEIPSPKSINPACDDELVRIIKKAMAPEPADRHATALDLQADLDEYIESLGQPVKQKEIGEIVSDLFQTTRRELKQLIELQLKRLDSGEDSSAGVPIVGFPDVNPSASQLHAGAMEPRGRWLPVVAVLGTLAILAIFLGTRQRAAQPPAVVAQPPVAQERQPEKDQIESEKPVEQVLQLATLRFEVSPPIAQLYFDNAPLAPGTQSKVVPVDSRVHVLRAEADGFRSASVEFVASGDKTVELALAKKAAKPAARVVPTRKHSKAPTSKAPEPTPVDCSKPFYIDSSGIKRVRAECR